MEATDVTQTGTVVPQADKNQQTLRDYVGDMVALESHIEEALDHQLGLAKDEPMVREAVQTFHDMVKSQRDAIKALQDEIGTTAGNPVIKAGSAILGKAAGMIEKIRTEGISKALRDDYTAFNLAAVSYTMLYTTATALGDQRVADVAEKHLRGYAGAVQKINHLVGDTVVAELRKDGHDIQGEPAAATKKMVDAAWKATDSSGMKA